MSDWIFTGTAEPSNRIADLPEAPSWRRFDVPADEGLAPLKDEQAILMINAALVLRRPLLVTGPPGSGKSTLARLVAKELDLGAVLRWPITTSSRLRDGLYEYDAIGRVHDENYGNGGTGQDQIDIGRYIRLGPLGTALLPSNRPRVLLIDEIDKSDIDLPSDLLHVFEEGEFTIKELERLPNNDKPISVRTADNKSARVRHGVVRCQQFPFVLLTSNGERTFPAPFLRRCLRLELKQPSDEQLTEILKARIYRPSGIELSEANTIPEVEDLVQGFEKSLAARKEVATDQLLNAVFLVLNGESGDPARRQILIENLLAELRQQ